MNRNQAILELREAIDILAGDSSRWGSDYCACDDCAKLRRKARLDAITALSRAVTELGGE